MSIDPISQILIVAFPTIMSLIISYAFFENSFNYFLYFELIFLTLFVGLEIIDFWWLSIVIFVISIIIYRAIEPRLKEREV